MASGIHLTDATHCLERVLIAHNSTPYERKISMCAHNMAATETRNTTKNIPAYVTPLRFTIHPFNLMTIQRRRAHESNRNLT